ncbi:MAG: 2-thiouracil desulfurase family protein [Candidatus Bathyarchaeia archaeon]
MHDYFRSKVLIVSHCLLNKSVRWWQKGKPPERNIGLANEIVQYALKHNIGLIQMPCPEFTFCGNPRPSRTKDEYERLQDFRNHCKKLAESVTEQIRTLTTMSENPQIQIVAVIGIKRSPSCAVNSAIAIKNGVVNQNEKGIFIELLKSELSSHCQIIPPFFEYDFDNPNELIEILEKLS